MIKYRPVYIHGKAQGANHGKQSCLTLLSLAVSGPTCVVLVDVRASLSWPALAAIFAVSRVATAVDCQLLRMSCLWPALAAHVLQFLLLLVFACFGFSFWKLCIEYVFCCIQLYSFKENN